MEHPDLPLRPSRGNRRRLDVLWLEALEQHGLMVFLPEPPSEPPPELHRAVEEFNGRLFWNCHETLEHVWRAAPYPLRHFYHGIIKVAVGFFQLSRHNRRSATGKLSEGARLLGVFTPTFFGVDTELLCRDTAMWLPRLQPPGSLSWRELDALPTPQIQMLKDSLRPDNTC